MPTLQEEQDAFNAQLDELLKDHAGQFVLFKDGGPIEFFPDQITAYSRGLEKFGLDQIFLVAPVIKTVPEPVSVSWEAGVMFG